jgi:hypothetical protein
VVTGDHQHEADRLRIGRIEAEPHQPLGDRAAEARARISAGQDADQRDADLHGRQEPPGIGGKVERGLRAAMASLDHRLEPRLARRHDRQLRHGENAVQRDQHGNDGDVEPGERRGGW